MITTVIVTYDSAACVGTCIASVHESLPCSELLVVDNASRDDTISVIHATAPQAHLIQSPENVGFGRACNIGAEAAHGSHLLFLNPDVVVTAVDSHRLNRLLAGQPFGLVAPAFEDELDRRRRENSWAGEYFAHTLENVRPHEWRPRVRRSNETKAAWVSGGMLLVSRAEFLEVGGFDPRFFLYYEDRDLSRRYRNRNLPIRTTDAMRGRHRPGTSSASNGLRVEPMAWSFLGWIQYLCIHDGEQTAQRAARSTLATLRTMRRGVRAAAALRLPRARRKARQLDELFRFLQEQSSSEDTGFCPDAFRVLKGLA